MPKSLKSRKSSSMRGILGYKMNTNFSEWKTGFQFCFLKWGSQGHPIGGQCEKLVSTNLNGGGHAKRNIDFRDFSFGGQCLGRL